MPLPESISGASDDGVYYLHGADEFRKDQAARRLVERFADAGTRDFNLDRLDGARTTVEQLATVAATPPMMAERRVVHLVSAEALAGSAKARAVLLDLAKSPPPGLVLIVQATVPGRSTAKFYKELARLATTAEFKAIPENEAPAWLVTWAAEELEAVVELDAARALAAALGSNLGMLSNEVRKLAGMVADGAPVDLEAVRAGGFEIARQDRWAWFDAVGRRRIAEALKGLPVLVRQGEAPIALVSGLAAHLLRIGVAAEGGASALKAALPPHQKFLAKRLASQARQWNRADLAAAVRRLRRLDRLLKASSLPGDGLLEEWLHGVAARDAPARAGRRRKDRMAQTSGRPSARRRTTAAAPGADDREESTTGRTNSRRRATRT